MPYLYGWRYKLKGLGIRYVVAYEHQKRGKSYTFTLC